MEEKPVEAAIWQALAHFNFEDAIFLAERLHAEVNNEDSLYILAVSYYSARRLKAAHHLLKSSSSPKSRYLLAKCCLDLDDFGAAQQAIIGNVLYSGPDTLDKVCSTFGESASYALALLGHIYRRTVQTEKASEVYNRALKLNPFLWSVFEALAAVGEKPDPLKIFTASNASNFVSPKKPNSSSFAPLQASFGIHGSNLPAFETPMIPVTHATNSSQRKPKDNQLSNLFFGGSTAAFATGASSPADSTVVLRRSSRLSATTRNAVKENAKGASKSSSLVGTLPTKSSGLGETVYKKTNTKSSKSISTSHRLSKTTRGKMKSNEISEEVAATMQNAAMVTTTAISVECFMQLLQRLGMAQLELAQYQCQRCIDCLNTLPAHQLKTSWVLSTLGKAYFEMAEYTQSVHYFKQLRRQFPCVLDGLEYYSSALWHLQQKVELSVLSNQLVDIDELSPETLCALGNFFSLQNMPKVAIEHLEKATKLHPKFSYAFTLLGDELLQAEKLDEALTCFLKAMSIDHVHYRACHGVGMVHYKQGQFELAEFYLKKAININANNSVLLCQIGKVQYEQKKPEALSTFNSAIQMNSKNHLAKLYRASVFYAQDKLQEALKDLKELQELSQNEASVYVLLGKVYKKLGNEPLALMNFCFATNIYQQNVDTKVDLTSQRATTQKPTTKILMTIPHDV